MGRLLTLVVVAAAAVVVAAVPAATIPAPSADWSTLERHQQTITHTEFDRLITKVYCPSGTLTNYLAFTNYSVTVYSTPAKTNALFTLRYASTPPPLNLNPNLTHPPNPPPLRRIALDPGHIGGEWARIEERFFQRGHDRPVQEAVLNLSVTRLLKPKLEAAGLIVLLTKDNFQPVTDKRPADFRAQAERDIAKLTTFDAFPPLEREAAIADAVRKRQELLFFRTAELAARARRVNDELKPDLTLCLHFNAVEWNDSHDLVDDNRLVVFIHGNYTPGELTDDDQKFHLFRKLLERSHETELALAEAVAKSLATATQLPPVQYEPVAALAERGMFPTAVRVGGNPYVYARNLAANHLYNGPVIYLEPYYMNNRLVYQRLQLGDYEGEREIEGRKYKSIFREYADAVAAGLMPFIRR